MRHRKRKKAASRVIFSASLVIVAIALMAVLVFSQVFRVRSVMVVGNRNLLREEVVTQSGVKPGDNALTITAASLRRMLEQNRYIEYVGHGFDYRGTLTIQINERMGMAVCNVLGLYYVLDESGVVLECAGSVYPQNVAGPRVSGIAIDQNARITVGEKFPAREAIQLEVMQSVLLALDETGLLARVSLLDLKNLENIYLMTSDGAKIELGDSANLWPKMLTAHRVLGIREEMGDLKGAKIDVSSGRKAHYVPPVLPTVTPVPTNTPTLAPPTTPKP